MESIHYGNLFDFFKPRSRSSEKSWELIDGRMKSLYLVPSISFIIHDSKRDL